MSGIEQNTSSSAGFRLAVLVEGALGLVALPLGWLFGISLRGQFPATSRQLVADVLVGIAATLPMLVLFWSMLGSRWRPLVELRNTVRQMAHELFPDPRMGQIIMIAALAGVSEELLFRGVVQTGIAQWTNPLVGLLVASVVFGVLHSISRLYFALATLIGVYLGWLLIASGDLTVPIIAHGLYDVVALVYLTRLPDCGPLE
jgi:CAAX protease family protein